MKVLDATNLVASNLLGHIGVKRIEDHGINVVSVDSTNTMVIRSLRSLLMMNPERLSVDEYGMNGWKFSTIENIIPDSNLLLFVKFY